MTETNLHIYEVDYSVSPGGINSFEVYDHSDDSYINSYPIFESVSLTPAVEFCYNLGMNFTVHTLAQYHAEEEMNA
jgi:hypothetical protein